MKKVLSCILTAAMVLAAGPGFASYSVIQVGGVPQINTIGASGTINSVTDFSVTLVDTKGNVVTGGLDFTPPTNGGDYNKYIGVAPQIVRVAFNDNSAVQRQVIIYTDNRANSIHQYVADPNGNKGPGSGLIGETGYNAAPLFWTIFDNLTDSVYSFSGTVDGAIDYQWNLITQAEADASSTDTITDADVGRIDPSASAHQSYVIDKQQGDVHDATADSHWEDLGLHSFDDTAINPKTDKSYGDEVVGAATVLYGISGAYASLANVPYNNDDPNTTTDNSGNPIVENRVVSDGDAYIRLACDYHGQPAQSYGTETLALALVVVS